MRRATGPMVAAWLLATVSAVGVAWVAVHPVANLGLTERPPVPRPEIADSPGYSDEAHRVDNHANSESRAAAAASPDASTGPPSRSPLPSRSPARPKPSGSPVPPPASPSAGPSATAPDVVYREASTDGGTATFEYVEGTDVYVVAAEPHPGWQVSAYRYYRDWVVVEFLCDGHRSTLHAYIDQGQARVDVVEEDT